MAMTPDEVLAELLQIRSNQQTLEPGSPAYIALEKRRRELRALARDASDLSRGRASLEAELTHLEARLRELDEHLLDVPEWQESIAKYSINEPGAHLAKINMAIEDNDENERTGIESRIAQIKKSLAE